MSKLAITLYKTGFVLAEVFLFPKTARSFYLYFTTDLGEDAFELVLLAKYGLVEYGFKKNNSSW